VLKSIEKEAYKNKKVQNMFGNRGKYSLPLSPISEKRSYNYNKMCLL